MSTTAPQLPGADLATKHAEDRMIEIEAAVRRLSTAAREIIRAEIANAYLCGRYEEAVYRLKRPIAIGPHNAQPPE